MGNGDQRHAPAALLQGKNLGSIVGEAALAARPIWAYLEGEKNLIPPPGFQPRTVQPVANLCTDYTIPAP